MAFPTAVDQLDMGFYLQDTGNGALSKLLRMCPSRLCKSKKQGHLNID